MEKNQDLFLRLPVGTADEARQAATVLIHEFYDGMEGHSVFIDSKIVALGACLRYLVWLAKEDPGRAEILLSVQGLAALLQRPGLDLFDRLNAVPGNQELLWRFAAAIRERDALQLECMLCDMPWRLFRFSRFSLTSRPKGAFERSLIPNWMEVMAQVRALFWELNPTPLKTDWTFMGLCVGDTSEAIAVAYSLLDLLNYDNSERGLFWEKYYQGALYYLALCVQYLARLSLQPNMDPELLQSIQGLAVLVDRNMYKLFELFESLPRSNELLYPFRSALKHREDNFLVVLFAAIDVTICRCSTEKLVLKPDGVFAFEPYPLYEKSWKKAYKMINRM